MKFIKDLEILTPERIKEVEQKYNNMFYVVRTYYTDPFYKHFYQKYVDGKVYNSKEEALKACEDYAKADKNEYHKYEVINVLHRFDVY